MVGPYTAVVAPRRPVRLNLYPGPDAVWLFVERNKRLLVVLACGILLLGGGIWLVTKYWQGCPSTTAARSAVAALRQDPLLTALPPGATSTPEWTDDYSCAGGGRSSRRSPGSVFSMASEYRLTNPMTVAALHDYHVASVGLGDWRLTHSDRQTLTYCRQLASFRVVVLMTVDDRHVTRRLLGWGDPAPCNPEVTITR